MNFSDEGAAFSSLRRRMVEAQLRARGIGDERVLDAMLRVPRHEFAPERYRDQAYEDHPLAHWRRADDLAAVHRCAACWRLWRLGPRAKSSRWAPDRAIVTAVLAELAAQVVSVERHAALADAARELLSRLGYTNVRVIVEDGSRGFAEGAPYDAIIVSAAAAEVPPALLVQLAEGGRMIIPVGAEDSQQLQLIRMENGQPRISLHELCRFVPLILDDRC